MLGIAARLRVQYAVKQCRACPCARRISQISVVAVQAAALERRANLKREAVAKRQSCQRNYRGPAASGAELADAVKQLVGPKACARPARQPVIHVEP